MAKGQISKVFAFKDPNKLNMTIPPDDMETFITPLQEHLSLRKQFVMKAPSYGILYIDHSLVFMAFHYLSTNLKLTYYPTI